MKDKPDTKSMEYRLWRLVEGDVDQAEADQLRARVRTDSDLADLEATERKLSDHLDALAEAQDEVIDRTDWDSGRAEIMARLERQALLDGPRKRRFLRHPWKVAAAVAAAVLLAAGISLWLTPETPSAGPVAQVRMVPAQAPPGGSGVISVSTRRGMDYEDFALAPRREGAAPQPETSPPGTVALSFGDAPPALDGQGSSPPMGL